MTDRRRSASTTSSLEPVGLRAPVFDVALQLALRVGKPGVRRDFVANPGQVELSGPHLEELRAPDPVDRGPKLLVCGDAVGDGCDSKSVKARDVGDLRDAALKSSTAVRTPLWGESSAIALARSQLTPPSTGSAVPGTKPSLR